MAAQRAAKVAALCRYIEQAEHVPTLAEWAERAGLSTFHLHRLFNAISGLTPRDYANGRRAQRFRRELEAGRPRSLRTSPPRADLAVT
ncbi:MAG: helix-turn-helix domain-containing protein [Burkholderiales bacterium]